MSKTLIASISGIRGIFGRGLDSETLVRYAAAYGTWVRQRTGPARKPVVVVGRDGRVTGSICLSLTISALQSTGCDVLDADLSTTPTIEMAVLKEKADGGIILSASHNPVEWNALKLLNDRGEFLSAEEGAAVLDIAHGGGPEYVDYSEVGSVERRDYLDYHIDAILDLPYIDPEVISRRGFRIVVDGINSVGGIAVPALLERLGVRQQDITCLNCEPTGLFAHEAEPLPENVGDLMAAVRDSGADLGIAVDPDVDRLAFVTDGGDYLGEELTQVVTADFLWRIEPGPFVTNLSSSRAIDDVAARHGQTVHRSAVGEINVVKKMQAVGAILGGEGNGGVIVPELHYGRDALVGIAMVLQHLTNLDTSLSAVKRDLPRYVIAKNKLSIEGRDPDRLLAAMTDRYRDEADTTDGVKISFESGWVHLRKSNTEPIIRIYTEASTREEADALASRFMDELTSA